MGQDDGVGYATAWFLLWLEVKESGAWAKLFAMPYSLDVEMCVWMLGQFPSYRDTKLKEAARR